MSIRQFVIFSISLVGDGSSPSAVIDLQGFIDKNGVHPKIASGVFSASGSVGGVSVATSALSGNVVTLTFSSAPADGATGTITLILTF